jgi:hypothetical protein
MLYGIQLLRQPFIGKPKTMPCEKFFNNKFNHLSDRAVGNFIRALIPGVEIYLRRIALLVISKFVCYLYTDNATLQLRPGALLFFSFIKGASYEYTSIRDKGDP